MAYLNGYSYRRLITIDHTKVSGGSHLVNFPFLFKETNNDFKTTTYSGKVTNTSGFDIVFESISGGSLDFEILNYSQSTGEYIAWVKIPNVSVTQDTTFYVYYGNSSVSTTQENVADVWANYHMVVHGKNLTTLTLLDVTGNSHIITKSSTNKPYEDTGLIHIGQHSDGTNWYVRQTKVLSASGPWTLQMWCKPTSNGAIMQPYNAGNWLTCYIPIGSTQMHIFIGNGTAYGNDNTCNNALVYDAWNQWAITNFASGAGGGNFYLNGNLNKSLHSGGLGSQAGDCVIEAQTFLGNNALNGIEEEIRIAKTELTRDWLVTEYNNQYSVSTFYSLGDSTTSPISKQKYKIEIYRLDIANNQFDLLDVITTFKNLSYYNGLNKIGACSFQMATQDMKATKSNLNRYVNTVVVWREGVIEWFGPIVRVYGAYQNVTGTITVECNTWLAHLKDRYTAKLVNYTNTNQLDIAWGLINTAQAKTNGTLLISRGLHPASFNRDRTYEYANVADSLMNLSDVIYGFDFTFDALTTSDRFSGVEFNSYYVQKGTVRGDLPVLVMGENIKELTFRTDGGLYNDIAAIGQGSGDVIEYETYDTNMMLSYSRRESISSQKDISILDTLQRKANTLLNNSKIENYLLEVVLYQNRGISLDDLELGDTLNMDISLIGGGYVDFVKLARITEIAVDVDNQGAETISPKFNIIY